MYYIHLRKGSDVFDEEFTKELQENMKGLETSSKKDLLFKIESLIQENKELIIKNNKLSSFKITTEEFELKIKNAIKDKRLLRKQKGPLMNMDVISSTSY
jgi:hypothetical protein